MSTIEKAIRTPPAAEADGDEPITILLVDDDPDCRLLVRDAIADCKAKYNVFEARSAEEALRFLRRQEPYELMPKPGLVYLDIEMPGMNGIQLLEKIKSDPALRDITVVMMTGVSDENQMREASRSGANSYTIKPANAEQFLKTVMESTNYWLTIHQYPNRHLPPEKCRR